MSIPNNITSADDTDQNALIERVISIINTRFPNAKSEVYTKTDVVGILMHTLDRRTILCTIADGRWVGDVLNESGAKTGDLTIDASSDNMDHEEIASALLAMLHKINGRYTTFVDEAGHCVMAFRRGLTIGKVEFAEDGSGKTYINLGNSKFAIEYYLAGVAATRLLGCVQPDEMEWGNDQVKASARLRGLPKYATINDEEMESLIIRFVAQVEKTLEPDREAIKELADYFMVVGAADGDTITKFLKVRLTS